MERIAVISDIHGNVPALEAVLADIRARGISRIFCLGDLVGKGPQPDLAVDSCREVCEVVVKGNHDDIMADGRDHPKLPFLGWHRERLGPERLAYLRNLPGTRDFTFGGRRIRLYHASHLGVHHRVHMDASEEDHEAMFTGTDFTGNGFAPDTVGYGDIHQVFMKNRSGRVLFNAGSVGNPLDEPLAAYVILESTGAAGSREGFSLNVVRLPYDIERAVRIGAGSDFPDDEQRPWERELRTARYRFGPPSRTGPDGRS
jgi:protein phosphatase